MTPADRSGVSGGGRLAATRGAAILASPPEKRGSPARSAATRIGLHARRNHRIRTRLSTPCPPRRSPHSRLAAPPSRPNDRAAPLPASARLRPAVLVGVRRSPSLGMVVVAAGDLIMAMLVIPIVNNFQKPDPARTQWLPLAVIGVFLFRGIGSYISEYGMAYTGHRVVFDLRRALIDKLLRLPTPYYDATPAGVIQSKLTFDAHQLASAASGDDHHRDPQHADDRREPRLAAVHQLEADGDDVLRAADRRRRHPLFQPAAAPHRARRADAHRLDDARARGDDRRPPDRPRVRRRSVRARRAPSRRPTRCARR